MKFKVGDYVKVVGGIWNGHTGLIIRCAKHPRQKNVHVYSLNLGKPGTRALKCVTVLEHDIERNESGLDNILRNI